MIFIADFQFDLLIDGKYLFRYDVKACNNNNMTEPDKIYHSFKSRIE